MKLRTVTLLGKEHIVFDEARERFKHENGKEAAYKSERDALVIYKARVNERYFTWLGELTYGSEHGYPKCKHRIEQDVSFGPPFVFMHNPIGDLAFCAASPNQLNLFIPPEWYNDDLLWVDSQREYLCREMMEFEQNMNQVLAQEVAWFK